jgi:protein-tyrosine phosphatase
LLRQEGLEEGFTVASAGTDAYHTGQPPDHRAVKVAKRHGIALERQKARPLVENDYHVFDYIYAMDGGHYYVLNERAPSGPVRASIRMFIDDREVPDPWYGDEKDFEDAFGLIMEGSANILKTLKEERQL